jgi:uncharacterized membrane protein
MALVVLVLFVAFGLEACQRVRPATLRGAPKTFASALLVSTAKKPDFDNDIKPIFQARCQPCHFQGGQVYDKMPFDKPETITRLSTKLFTRIKDEKEQRLISEFLAQP